MVAAGPGVPQSSHIVSLESQQFWGSHFPLVPSPTRSNAVAGSVPRISTLARHVAIAQLGKQAVSARGHRTPVGPTDSKVGLIGIHDPTTGGATTMTMASCAQTRQEVDLKAYRVAIPARGAKTAAMALNATGRWANGLEHGMSNWEQADRRRGQSGWIAIAAARMTAVLAAVKGNLVCWLSEEYMAMSKCRLRDDEAFDGCYGCTPKRTRAKTHRAQPEEEQTRVVPEPEDPY